MKKLLALVLCVMMFVAVIPTSAFAATLTDHPDIDNPLMSVAQYNKELQDMIKKTKSEIETAYQVLVMDKSVYSTAKGMDDVIVSLVDGVAKSLIADGILGTAYVNEVKDAVRALIDAGVASKMAANAYKYTNSDGSKDPLAYAQVFADSVSSALTDKKLIAGYQNVATYWAIAKLVNDVDKELAKQYAAFQDSVDASFDAKFEDRYPELWANYIDTFADEAAGLDFNGNPWAIEDYAFVVVDR